MTYSQPDPAEETTAAVAPEEPDTEEQDVESDGSASPSLTVDSDDVPTGDSADSAAEQPGAGDGATDASTTDGLAQQEEDPA